MQLRSAWVLNSGISIANSIDLGLIVIRSPVFAALGTKRFSTQLDLSKTLQISNCRVHDWQRRTSTQRETDMRYLDNPAILFGAPVITGLGVARSLGRSGVRVYCVSERKSELAFSRYCARYFAVPQIESDKQVLKKFLSSIKKELEHPSVLFPCSDPFTISLPQIRDESNTEIDGQYVTFGKSETVETLVNKRRFYRSLDKYGVHHPTTYFPETIQDVENISKQVEYPTYVRPSVTKLFDRFERKGFVARSEAELMQLYSLTSKFDVDVMIQEIIPGPATNKFGINGYFDEKHHPKAFFAYHRLREYPLGFANSSLMESISISDVLCMKEVAENYLKRLGYYGIFDAEFKKDPRDDDFKLLEINARAWWQNSFSAKCGINLLLMAYLDAIGKKIEYLDSYETGVKWLHFTNDLLSSIEMLCKRQTTVREWLSSYRKVDDYAHFSPDDLLPWAAFLLLLSRRYPRQLAHATLD